MSHNFFNKWEPVTREITGSLDYVNKFNMKLLKKISFTFLGVILLVLMLATIIEKLYGSDFVYLHIYSSVPFVMLWVLLTVFSVIYLVKRKIYKNLVSTMLHASFLLILGGAFITWLYGEQGMMHLRVNQESASFIDNDGAMKEMSFVVELKDFRVVYYDGTRAPMDFVSALAIVDNKSNSVVEGDVSMNNIFSYRGYRFYQSGYDKDEGGSTLAVSHDPYGIAVTYSGYALLLLSIASFFFNRRSRFFNLLKNPLLTRGATVCFVLLVFASGANASDRSEGDASVGLPRVLPKKVAAEFCDLYVLYNDRICPLQTVAKDFTVKLYGSASYKGLTPEQVFTGWMFYHSGWKMQPMIKIKSKNVRQLLGITGKYASLDDYYDKYNEYKLEEIIKKIRLGENVEDKKGIEEADEKFNLISILYSGKLLKIYPHDSSGENIVKKIIAGNDVDSHASEVRWYSQGDVLPDDLFDDEWFFVRKSLDYAYEMVVKKDYDGLSGLLAKLKSYQQKKAGDVLPSDGRLNAEKIYNGLNYTKHLAILCVIIGLLSFLLYCNCLVNDRNVNGKVEVALCFFAATALSYLSVVIGLRWYISGYVPLSNGFETMQFMAWCSIALSFSLRKKFFMLLPFGFLLCGLTLMVAMMGEANPRITQLMPVLSSPLLSIHVAVIMVAYSLFAFMMLNGITAVILSVTNKNNDEQIERLHVISQIILYPAVFCLAIGIFVGAVWANISWGRYWGWDPKEVWALITMLVYSFALHSGSLPWFRRPMFFHIYVIIAFLSVLITYFGVNYLLGGMHSYA